MSRHSDQWSWAIEFLSLQIPKIGAQLVLIFLQGPLLMVLFFVGSDGYMMYMGKDKFENEELIKYGLPEDIWFHVDKLSSAHVYLRMKPSQTLEDVPESIIMECAQLVKANSIEGNIWPFPPAPTTSYHRPFFRA